MIFSQEFALSGDITELACALSDAGSITYTLTEGESGWLEFVRGRYAIADLLLDCMHPSEEGEPDTVTLDAWDISRALEADDSDRPVCLSEDTALCRICWCVYSAID